MELIFDNKIILSTKKKASVPGNHMGGVYGSGKDKLKFYKIVTLTPVLDNYHHINLHRVWLCWITKTQTLIYLSVTSHMFESLEILHYFELQTTMLKILKAI